MKVLIIVVGLVLVILGALYAFGQTQKISNISPSPYQGLNKPTDADAAIEKAREVYNQKKRDGVDMTDGPCLAEELMSDWSFDIAHNPRQKVDDNPQNQCQDFKNSKTHHFVEFDPDGNLIRAL